MAWLREGVFGRLIGAGMIGLMIAGLMAVGLMSAGCGLLSSTAGKDPGASPADEQGKPIVIGASLSLTGSYERYGKNIQQAYELWKDEVNARGGLLGRRVELKIYDDQSEPETGARLYEKLITDDKADLLLGPYSTPVTLSVTNVSEKYKKPVLAAGAAGAKIWQRGFRYVFGLYSQAPTYSHGALEIAKAQGFKTVAFVSEDTAFPQDVIKGAAEKAKELGLEIVFQESYPPKSTDFSVLVQKLKGKNPDLVVGGTYLPDSTAIVRQARDLNWAPKMWFFTTGPALPDFGKNLGKLAENVTGNTEWESAVKGEGVTEFVAAFRTRYGNEPGYHAAGGYAAGQVMEAAVKQAGSLDPEKIREALAAIEVPTVYGPYKVNAEGAQIGKPNYIIQWRGGQRVVVWPEKSAGGQVKLPFEWGQ